MADGRELLAFADSVLSRDPQSIASSRATLESTVGRAATVDAAAVVANFQRMVRIADSTGIPLDEPVLMMTQGIRDELRINDFQAAANSPPLSFGKRLLGRLLGPFAPAIIGRIARRRFGAAR